MQCSICIFQLAQNISCGNGEMRTWCHRSPLADPNAKGVICGLSLDSSEKQLALLYLATVQGLAYGTRHIVEHCNAHGHKVTIYIVLPIKILYLELQRYYSTYWMQG